jgi:UDP-glucose 4-epimerase
MKILVIGGTGFIGRHLCRSLTRNHEVSVFARHTPSTEKTFLGNPNVKFILGDVTQSASAKSACSGIDCIVYLASTVIPSTSNLDPIFDIQSNLIGAVNTLDAAIINNVSRFIFLSSGGTVYGGNSNLNFKETDPTDPMCSYGITKLAIEKYIAMYHRLQGLSYSILRLSNPFGPGYTLDKPQGVIGFFASKILSNEAIDVWGDGSVERDFIYIEDVVLAIEESINTLSPSLLLNIGTGIGTSVNELIDLLESILNRKTQVRYQPSRSFDVQRAVLDISAAKDKLNWIPRTSLQSGIRLMLKHGSPKD